MDLKASLPPRRRLILWSIALIGLAISAPRLQRENFLAEGGELQGARDLPELPAAPAEDWLGTDPLTVDDLRGRVQVLKVWTFGCVNCVRSIPYANSLTTRYGDSVGVLGIHSPEFDWERDEVALQRALVERDVRFPSFIDRGLDYFFALEAPGWPAFYVVDRNARIRGRWIGEVHEGTRRAAELEALIERLVAE